MTTFVTINPHYCDLKYGEAVADRIFYMKTFGIPRRIPVFSNLFLGYLNSFLLPKDSLYFCEGPTELYPMYYKKPNARIIATLKDNTLFNMQFMPPAKKKFLIKLLSICDAFIVDTKYMKSLAKKYFDTETKIHPPFCAQPFFDVRPNLESKNILFIGDANKQKGFIELAETMKYTPDWNLYLVGTCSHIMRKFGVSNNVHIEDYQKDLGPYFNKCSFYVHPASFDVFGVTVLEAMSTGIIPIVTRMTGASEMLIKNGLKDLVIGNNKPETIKEKLESVYNWGYRKKLSVSNKCKEIVRKNYTEEVNVERFKKIFQSLA